MHTNENVFAVNSPIRPPCTGFKMPKNNVKRIQNYAKIAIFTVPSTTFLLYTTTFTHNNLIHYKRFYLNLFAVSWQVAPVKSTSEFKKPPWNRVFLLGKFTEKNPCRIQTWHKPTAYLSIICIPTKMCSQLFLLYTYAIAVLKCRQTTPNGPKIMQKLLFFPSGLYPIYCALSEADWFEKKVLNFKSSIFQFMLVRSTSKFNTGKYREK